MKQIIYFLLFVVFILATNACGQDFSKRSVSGKEYAEVQVKKAKQDKNYKPFYDILIADEETAIRIAEAITFKIYGEKEIIRQRPYECYLIDGFWFVGGTLPKGSLGGTFEIIINASNCQVINLSHGK